LKVPGIPGDEREPVLDGDGGDAKVGLADADARFFQFGFNLAEENAAFPIERENFECRENFLFEGFQNPPLFWAPAGAEVDFADIDRAGVLRGGRKGSQSVSGKPPGLPMLPERYRDAINLALAIISDSCGSFRGV
jgi:hypothetical protein